MMWDGGMGGIKVGVISGSIELPKVHNDTITSYHTEG